MVLDEPSNVNRNNAPNTADRPHKMRQCVNTITDVDDTLLLDDISTCFRHLDGYGSGVIVAILRRALEGTTTDQKAGSESQHDFVSGLHSRNSITLRK